MLKASGTDKNILEALGTGEGLLFEFYQQTWDCNDVATSACLKALVLFLVHCFCKQHWAQSLSTGILLYLLHLISPALLPAFELTPLSTTLLQLPVFYNVYKNLVTPIRSNSFL